MHEEYLQHYLAHKNWIFYFHYYYLKSFSFPFRELNTIYNHNALFNFELSVLPIRI